MASKYEPTLWEVRKSGGKFYWGYEGCFYLAKSKRQAEGEVAARNAAEARAQVDLEKDAIVRLANVKAYLAARAARPAAPIQLDLF